MKAKRNNKIGLKERKAYLAYLQDFYCGANPYANESGLLIEMQKKNAVRYLGSFEKDIRMYCKNKYPLNFQYRPLTIEQFLKRLKEAYRL